jgi:zinc resistance-associated protein
MHKIVTAGATALMLIAGASAYAQQPPTAPDVGRRQQVGPEDPAAFLDARIAALHAGLRLTPEQEKSWPAFERAYRDRDARRADALADRSVAVRRYADALAPLYQSLDDSQKRRFGFLSRVERRRAFALFRGGDRGEFRSRRGEFRVPGRESPTRPR